MCTSVWNIFMFNDMIYKSSANCQTVTAPDTPAQQYLESCSLCVLWIKSRVNSKTTQFPLWTNKTVLVISYPSEHSWKTGLVHTSLHSSGAPTPASGSPSLWIMHSWHLVLQEKWYSRTQALSYALVQYLCGLSLELGIISRVHHLTSVIFPHWQPNGYLCVY